MVGRRLPVAACGLVAALALAACWSAAAATPGGTAYRLRADARMCPSPACGGLWATRVNAALTTCPGGTTRPACYATSVDLSAANTPQRWSELQRSLARLIVVGRLVATRLESPPRLYKLAATEVWRSAGSRPGTSTVYRVVDTGVRCVRAPCFSLRATVVNATGSFLLSGVDLARAGAPAAAITSAHDALAHGGLLVSGTVQASAKTGDAGRTLVADQFWLRL